MADVAKYAPINGGNLISDFKSHFSVFKTRRTIGCTYVFIFFFIAFSIFLAFTPSSSSSAPWFTSIFSLPSTSNSSSLSSPSLSSPSLFSNQSYGSRVYGYFFPNSSSPLPSQNARSSYSSSIQQNFTKTEDPPHKGEFLKQNQTTTLDKVEALKANQSTLANSTVDFKDASSRTEDPPHKVEVLKQNETRIQDKVEVLNQNQSIDANFKNVSSTNGEKGVVVEKGSLKNLSSSLMKKQSNGTKEKKGDDDLIKSLMNCDFFDGNWVRENSYPLYKPGSCSLIDEQFNCFLNGRPDNGYLKLKWKPKGCNLPRLDGSHMLEMLRGKRLVFVGDSLNRNMWESLICILRNSVKDQKKVYEKSGRHHFKAEASYTFVFEDYKFTVEFFVAPFLVQEWELVAKNGTKKETLRLDLVSRAASNYKNADIIVFNTGHWWTHDKTSLGKDYYQEGTHVYSDLNVLEAFRKALTTWGRWIDANVNPKKSLVFFRGYSASHFSGGQWNSGGACDHETEPIKNDTYLTRYPAKMTVLENVLKGMKTPVTYLNVTRMTDYRKDGHPSVYRKLHMSEEEKIKPLQVQDCSHWCLPGVPDAWNEILYAELLVKLKQQGKHS